MTWKFAGRCGVGLILVLGLSSCSAFSSLVSATRSMDTYELSPLRSPGQSGRATGPALFIEEPSSSAAIQSERIAIMPSLRRIAYLPDAKWIEPAPVHFQRLVQQTLSNTGQYRFVTSRSTGPLPDYTILTDIESFQAEVISGEQQSIRVILRVAMTLLRDSDLAVVSTIRLEQIETVPGDEDAVIVAAFDQAATSILSDISAWVAANLGRTGS